MDIKAVKMKPGRLSVLCSSRFSNKAQGGMKVPCSKFFNQYSLVVPMHVSYPNAVDRAQAEKRGVSPGGMITVHGQRNGFGWLSSIMQDFDWTDGCIAITNDEMDEFMELVKPGTPIEIRW